MIKYTKKTMLMYTKTINDMVKRLKVVAKCCLNWIFFMVPSIVVLGTQTHQHEIFKTYYQKYCSKNNG